MAECTNVVPHTNDQRNDLKIATVLAFFTQIVCKQESGDGRKPITLDGTGRGANCSLRLL